MQYLLMKTGFEMLDVWQVYGLAEIIARARDMSGEMAPIRIADLGPAWEVDVPAVPRAAALARAVAQDLAAPVLSPPDTDSDSAERPPEWFLSRGWNYINSTYTTAQKARKAEEFRDDVRALAQRILRFEGGLFGGEAGEETTVPQGLEVAAGKGTRRAASHTHTATNLKRARHLWTLATVGATAVGSFVWEDATGPRGRRQRRRQRFAAVPVPGSVRYDDHREVRDHLRSAGPTCSASTTAAVAHQAVRVAQRIAQARTAPEAFSSTYSAIAFESMMPTGRQPKPGGGGLFPMQLLNKVVAASPVSAIRLCDTWEHLFRRGSQKGLEMLALSLAEFLSRPNLHNLERHIRTHLRFNLRDKSDDRYVGLRYPEFVMKGLFDHVRA